ncbi:hypothetical protein MMC25_005861 [Agyrium rufum]|nr:hypothetical protein [Agyrium rufum]
MSAISQVFPPRPHFTETSLPDLHEKVCIVTGAASGVGLELAKILYSKNATVYIGARSSSRVAQGIKAIQSTTTTKSGKLKSMVINLSDLTTIAPAADAFLAQETHLNLLVHNAGVMKPPTGSKTVQGYDLELGTNCLAPFLLTRHLRSILQATQDRDSQHPGSVRVLWITSLMDLGTPQGGVQFDGDGNPKQLKSMDNYMQSKGGMTFLAAEHARMFGNSGVMHLSVHPGLMLTELQRHSSGVQRLIMGTMLKGPKYGAYTELFAGFTKDITVQDNGSYVVAWGRKWDLPPHLIEGIKSKDEGGKGTAKQFYDWCDDATAQYQ